MTSAEVHMTTAEVHMTTAEKHTNHSTTLTIMHEWLNSPQLCPHNKAAIITGDVRVSKQLRKLHLFNNCTQQVRSKGLYVCNSQHNKASRRFVVGNQYA